MAVGHSRRFGINRIDLWSLDVEGAELQVLKAMDFSRVKVNALVVELDGRNKTRDDEIHNLLTSKGLVRQPSEEIRNGYYVHKDYLSGI